MTLDLGEPASYLTLAEGTPVYTSDGAELGKVEHVLADADADVFDGLIIDTRSGPGGHRFADAPLVDEIYDNGVLLTLDDAAAADLPEPSPSPATLEADPADTAPDHLGDKLRRAWDYLSGNY
jgi:sporulation protein YlmC with PRC-barrel domain